jgi:hypothetical protein
MTFVFIVTFYGCGSDSRLVRPAIRTFADYEPAYLHFIDMYDKTMETACEDKWFSQYRNKRYNPYNLYIPIDTSQEEEIVIEERTGTMGTGPRGEYLDQGWSSWGIIIMRLLV